MTENSKPILYLLDASVAVTGAFVSARNEAQVLKDAFRIVLVLPQGSTIAKQELRDFWRVEYLPIVNLSKTVSALLRYIPALLYTSWRLKIMMQKDDAKRLQVNDFFLMHGAILRLLGFRGNIVSWVRCDPKRFAGPLANIMLWCMKYTANRRIAVSKFIQSLLPIGCTTEIIYDCYSGPMRSPKIWQVNDEKTFVYIGNYIEGKGQDAAIRAFTRVASQNTSIRLAFYGGDMGLQKNRDYRKRLETMAQQSGFGARISFNDFVGSTYSVLESAFAALNFSNSESFSMTVLEASGAGVPVIATASGGPQEIIKEGISGFIVPVGDVAAAADRIVTLAQDVNRAAKMGQAGAEHMGQFFSQHSFREKLLSVFKP